MSFRFLKKKDGSKVLQQQCPLKNYAWEDVPMVEEKTVMDKLYSAVVLAEKNGPTIGKAFTLLVSTKIMNDIKDYYHGSGAVFPSLGKISTPNSFMYHRLYEVPDMKTDIQILIEV